MGPQTSVIASPLPNTWCAHHVRPRPTTLWDHASTLLPGCAGTCKTDLKIFWNVIFITSFQTRRKAWGEVRGDKVAKREHRGELKETLQICEDFSFTFWPHIKASSPDFLLLFFPFLFFLTLACPTPASICPWHLPELLSWGVSVEWWCSEMWGHLSTQQRPMYPKAHTAENLIYNSFTAIVGRLKGNKRFASKS